MTLRLEDPSSQLLTRTTPPVILRKNPNTLGSGASGSMSPATTRPTRPPSLNPMMVIQPGSIFGRERSGRMEIIAWPAGAVNERSRSIRPLFGTADCLPSTRQIFLRRSLSRYLVPVKALLRTASWSFIRISSHWAVTLRFLPRESSNDLILVFWRDRSTTSAVTLANSP